MMMRSREAVVDYMTPLGLAHLMASDHHYGPGPWVSDQPAPLWNPTYYHRADERGIGFDRSNSGTRAVSQYAPAVGRCLADLRCVPDKYLLWFHHVPWTYRLRSGGTLWSGLVESYDRGIGSVEQMQATWTRLRHRIDAQLQAEVAANLQQQLAEAKWWRNASIAYWQSVSGLPLPPGRAPPPHPLSWYKAVHFDTVPGFLAPRIDEHSKCPWAEGEAPCAN
jgi:alpha-glucuronidase